ncbi:DNA polymerase III, delta subunit [Prevotella sp. oral taxon 306 str. F0472]|uniref:DNA polymerase III subunit delta n=1 Tax=Prevotella sp. oral taxon 306 TaxID=712461 RepID=UPI00025BA107|nr:DNA polymerase III subunit delta [Prevotella sp. oral taxon 306]EID33538.1 DNA polymerase III, delta subunit [Prevotella sp. oral taxon 306 str. F0472]
MPTKQGVTFQAIMQDLKNRNFAPFYLLMGEESYYIDTISDYIASHVLLPEECDFNQTICFGSDVTAVQVTDMAKRYPMMAEFQVIIVKEAQNIRSLEALEGYLKKPVKSTILVWCHKNGKIDTRKKVIGLAQAMGVVFESKKLRDYQLPEFIQNYLKSKKATIDPKSCQMIANHIGSDLSRIVSELDKILIYLPNDNRRVTPDIVEKEIGVSKDFNAFELRNAIVSKDIFKANQIIKYFDNNPKAGSLYSFLPLLFSFFQNLMILHYTPNKSSEQDIARALDLNSTWGIKDLIIGLKNYSARKTMDIISKIREVDGKSKGLDNPYTGAGELMKELIFYVLH